MSGIIILDRFTEALVEPLAPHYNARDINIPNTIGRHMRFTSPIASMWGRYVHEGK